jgi:phosphoglycolate phosphatase-like HAD superfamily hydrolase
MKVCLFDIDGTLLSSGGAGKAAIEGALTEEFGVALTTQVTYSGRTDRAIARDLLQLHGIDYHAGNWERLRRGYLQRLPGTLARHPGLVLPGIARLLSTLAQQNITLGLLTGNIRDGARLKLSHYGLFEHFRFGGFGDLHYDRDEVAREALAAVHGHVQERVGLERIWVIGDTPLDIRCARAIGVKVAAVATGWHSLDELRAANPDLLLRDFSDPAPFLAML